MRGEERGELTNTTTHLTDPIIILLSFSASIHQTNIIIIVLHISATNSLSINIIMFYKKGFQRLINTLMVIINLLMKENTNEIRINNINLFKSEV